MNTPACIFPLLGWYFSFQLLRTGSPHLDDGFFAIDGSIEDTRIIAVLVSISVLFHNERPFTLVTLFPVERDSREIVGKVETNNRGAVSLECSPKYLLHELGTRVERKVGRE